MRPGTEPADAGSVLSPDLFRGVLGHLPTGVTIISTVGADGAPVGMTCNSFASVSLDPPLVAFCPARSSETWPRIREVGRFCVNVLAHHHRDTSVVFSKRRVDRFAGVSWHDRAGLPALDDAMAWIDCTLQDEHEAGDHLIVVAAVETLEATPATDLQPLVFFQGDYGTFDSPAD
jgi:3-hydroxy-9,10-secoandrosta-1,3,5(10)-triene-9,17-dione monooxygenase reductase component